MDLRERRDKGLLLRFRSSELEGIDKARGSVSRGRWVRQLVLDGLVAREELTAVANDESLLSRMKVSGSPEAQLRPASELVGSASVPGPKPSGPVSVKSLRGRGSRSLVDPGAPSTPLPRYAARRVMGDE